MVTTTVRAGVLATLLAGLVLAVPAAASAGTPPPVSASDHVTAVSKSRTTGAFGSVVPITRTPVCISCEPVGPSPKSLPSPFVFTYVFDHHLAIGGGYFTVGQPVIVRVVRDDGVRELNRQVIARTHAVTPGGAVYLHTDLAATCGSGPNGYVQAYDVETKRWSARTRVAICHFIDGSGDSGNHPADG